MEDTFRKLTRPWLNAPPIGGLALEGPLGSSDREPFSPPLPVPHLVVLIFCPNKYALLAIEVKLYNLCLI